MSTIKKLVFIGMAIIGLFFVQPAAAMAPQPTLLQQNDILRALSPQSLVDYYSEKYNVLKKANLIKEVIKCESGFNEKAVNMKDSHKGSKGSHGIAQFAYPTIEKYGKEIGIENPDPYNREQATEVMVYMFSKNKQSAWTCYNKYY